MEHLFDVKKDDFDVIDLNIAFEEELYDKNVLTNHLELFLQEIYIALMTAPNEIWGVNDSLNLNKYTFNKYITPQFINDEITEFIIKHCSQSSNFIWRVNSSIEVDSNEREFIFIEMIINTENGDVLKSFVLKPTI